MELVVDLSGSCIVGALLPSEKERMEGPRNHPKVGQEGGDGLDPTAFRVPKVRQGITVRSCQAR